MAGARSSARARCPPRRPAAPGAPAAPTASARLADGAGGAGQPRLLIGSPAESRPPPRRERANQGQPARVRGRARGGALGPAAAAVGSGGCRAPPGTARPWPGGGRPGAASRPPGRGASLTVGKANRQSGRIGQVAVRPAASAEKTPSVLVAELGYLNLFKFPFIFSSH